MLGIVKPSGLSSRFLETFLCAKFCKSDLEDETLATMVRGDSTQAKDHAKSLNGLKTSP